MIRFVEKHRALWLRSAALLHDAVMGMAALLLSLALRLNSAIFAYNLPEYLVAAVGFGLIVSVTGFLFGMNRGVWRYASLPDLVAIVKAASIAVLVFVALHFLVVRLEMIPRSSILIAWAFLVILLAAPRVGYRVYRNAREAQRTRGRPMRRALLVGATDAADLFLKSIREHEGMSFDVVAIIDERDRRTGRFIHGVPVLGPLDALPDIVDRFERRGRRPDTVIVTRTPEDFERGASLKQLIEMAGENRLEVLRLPRMLDMQSLDARIELRTVKLEDLLQRAPVSLESDRVAAMIENRSVLITGAGGSIGSELVRQVAQLGPARLVLVDASEYLLYRIEGEIARDHPGIARAALLCNVRERDAVRRVMAAHRPAVVFHAAALKHVPIVEAQPLEGLHTNAIGTRNVAEAAREAGAAAMILISTDKAVGPANAMGASKRLAETFCQAMDIRSGEAGTRFVTVRFGNVLGSAGSVVPLFERQIKAGGPLTVTHPEVERYFMTIPEASVLVLQAAAYSLDRREERGRIFVLDMGSPVKIVDLARNLIHLSGLRPDKDIEIVYTGLRPGEKLYEELFSAREALEQTGVPGILAASPHAIEQALIVRIFDEMARLIAADDAPGALRLLHSTVTDFTPGPEIQALMGPGARPPDIAPEIAPSIRPRPE